jgi:histidinol-phosphatase
MADWSADLAIALELATAADEITTRRFGAVDLAVRSKPDLTPVSDADTAVESMLRERLAATRPDDAVLGEEYGVTGDAARRWIVDPIDGTKNFVRGAPVWATLLALEVNGQIVVGVASAPALRQRWWAARGAGAWTAYAGEQPRRLAVSQVTSLDDAFLSYSSLTGWDAGGGLQRFVDLTNRVWRTRAFGDFWSHLLVAEGAVDISCEPEVSLWDLAALQPIVEEAGGRFTNLSGVDGADGGSVVCTNGRLHDDVLAVLTARE